MTMLRFLLLCLFMLTLSAFFASAEVVTSPPDCPVVENETIHLVMDRICEVCHEFSSHTQPNLRADCRASCFSTETFRRCLALFSPRRHTRHLHRHSHRV